MSGAVTVWVTPKVRDRLDDTDPETAWLVRRVVQEAIRFLAGQATSMLNQLVDCATALREDDGLAVELHLRNYVGRQVGMRADFALYPTPAPGGASVSCKAFQLDVETWQVFELDFDDETVESLRSLLATDRPGRLDGPGAPRAER